MNHQLGLLILREGLFWHRTLASIEERWRSLE
jgi:hypothetical protein